MSHGGSWVWPTLFLLGAYHGINPAMGWLFAVARGMQEKSRRAVGWSLAPIALGHGLAIALVIFLAALVGTFLPVQQIKILVAVLLFGLGVWRLVRSRHPRWGGMQVGFRDLTIWSFLMASAHGAGFMVLPVMLAVPDSGQPAARHAMHPGPTGGLLANLTATLVHTLGYLVITGLVAVLVYEKLGLALLRRAWVNLDLVWAAALIATGCLTIWI
jgi:hypothetical protein